MHKAPGNAVIMTKKKARKEILGAIKYTDLITKGGQEPPNLSLIHLIRYIHSLTELLKHRSSEKITVTIDNNGARTPVSLLEDSRWIFHHLLQHSRKRIETKSFKQYLKTSREFLTIGCVSLDLKTQLIDLENQHLKLSEANALQEHGASVEQIECRMLVCFEVLMHEELQESDNRFLGATNSVKKYLDKIINWFVYRGHLIQAQIYLQKLASEASNNQIKSLIIPAVIGHSKSFALLSDDQLNAYLDDNEHILDEDTLEHTRAAINTSPSNIKIYNFSFGSGTLSRPACQGKTIGTVIMFSIPTPCLRDEKTTIEPDEKHLISFEPINTFWEDPMFRILSGWNLGGVNWAFYCDIDPALTAKHTHVRLGIKEFYHPDAVLTNNSHTSIDFSDESARIGRTYYPHKDYVIKFLRENFESFEDLLIISKKDITANLFSNLVVQYNDASNGETLYQKIIAGTIPDSHNNSVTKYLEKCSKANVKDSLISIKTLLSDTPVTSNASLRRLVVKCLEVFVKHNIELSGDHIYCWDNENKTQTPKRESRLQPYIYNHLLPHFEFMGIQIVRESYAADGALDFLVSYNNEQQKKFTVCVELKLAHSGNIEDGLTKQLPEYMKGMRSRHGVFLYMWFKGKHYTEPKVFNDIDDLHDHLASKNSNPNISILGINCTKPQTPSKL